MFLDDFEIISSLNADCPHSVFCMAIQMRTSPAVRLDFPSGSSPEDC